MSAEHRTGSPGARFPGFDVVGQARSWDTVTAGVVLDRLRAPAPPVFFSAPEFAALVALADQLLDQHGDRPVPVASAVDKRLAAGQTDGWHFADLPPDADAWRITLALLDDRARELAGAVFAECPEQQQHAIVSEVQHAGSGTWRGHRADRVWSLWLRYCCTAYYAHPYSWNDIGFGGPAYPRGYKNLGLGRREHFEKADADPARGPGAGMGS